MIHFKNLKNLSAGFSFMEVMIAIVMLGMLMTAILTLQNTTFASVIDFSRRLRTMFLLRNKIVNAAFARASAKEEEKGKTPVPDEQKNLSEIKYSVEKINEQSSLKRFEFCFIEKANAQWQEGRKKNQEAMITFLYKAPEKKEDVKK